MINQTPHSRAHGPNAGPRSFRAGRGELLRQQLTATLAALRRNRTARNRHQAARARHDMRTWQIEHRKRTRHLIELGGLVVKSGIVDLTDDNRATILGALLWSTDKLKSDQGERARTLWAAKGKQAFEADPAIAQGNRSNCSCNSPLIRRGDVCARRLRGHGVRQFRALQR